LKASIGSIAIRGTIEGGLVMQEGNFHLILVRRISFQNFILSNQTVGTPENPGYLISFRVLRPNGSEIWLEDTGRALRHGG